MLISATYTEWKKKLKYLSKIYLSDDVENL